MWTDFFKLPQQQSSEPDVECVDRVESPGKPLPLRHFADASRSPRAFSESADCVDRDQVDTIDTGRHVAAASSVTCGEPVQPQAHQRVENASTLSTPSTQAEYPWPSNKRHTKSQEQFDLAVSAVGMVEHVAVDDRAAMVDSSKWEAISPEHPIKADLADVMTLYLDELRWRTTSVEDSQDGDELVAFVVREHHPFGPTTFIDSRSAHTYGEQSLFAKRHMRVVQFG